jgi:CheY-like chemotaxis protein
MQIRSVMAQASAARTRPETGSERGAARPAPHASGGRRQVLVAEDDPSLRRLIVTVLRDAGYDVVEAADGPELLERIEALAKRQVPSDAFVVVSDVKMPGLTGLDVLAILRCASARTPVVLITAFGDAETHAEARELGAVRVLDKPFDLDVLRAVVGEVAAC